MNPPEETLESLTNACFVCVDKPRGPSSHEVTTYVKKLFGAKRAGHAGTLDPQVSGVLVIALNRATKLIRFITAKDKTYVGVMRMKNPPKNIEALQAEFGKHIGKIGQIPPKESAVAKKFRLRKVYELKALELFNNNALFVARVEAGTYIRVLCQDVGRAYGGGMIVQLRRTKVGKISEESLVSLPELSDALYLARKGDCSRLKEILVPAENLLDMPSIKLSVSAEESACRGAHLALSGVAAEEAGLAEGAYVKLMGESGKFVSLGIVEGERILPKAVLKCEKKEK